MVHIGNSWDMRLEAEWTKPYYRRLRAMLVKEYQLERLWEGSAVDHHHLLWLLRLLLGEAQGLWTPVSLTIPFLGQ